MALDLSKILSVSAEAYAQSVEKKLNNYPKKGDFRWQDYAVVIMGMSAHLSQKATALR